VNTKMVSVCVFTIVLTSYMSMLYTSDSDDASHVLEREGWLSEDDQSDDVTIMRQELVNGNFIFFKRMYDTCTQQLARNKMLKTLQEITPQLDQHRKDMLLSDAFLTAKPCYEAVLILLKAGAKNDLMPEALLKHVFIEELIEEWHAASLNSNGKQMAQKHEECCKQIAWCFDAGSCVFNIKNNAGKNLIQAFKDYKMATSFWIAQSRRWRPAYQKSRADLLRVLESVVLLPAKPEYLQHADLVPAHPAVQNPASEDLSGEWDMVQTPQVNAWQTQFRVQSQKVWKKILSEDSLSLALLQGNFKIFQEMYQQGSELKRNNLLQRMQSLMGVLDSRKKEALLRTAFEMQNYEAVSILLDHGAQCEQIPQALHEHQNIKKLIQDWCRALQDSDVIRAIKTTYTIEMQIKFQMGQGARLFDIKNSVGKNIVQELHDYPIDEKFFKDVNFLKSRAALLQALYRTPLLAVLPVYFSPEFQKFKSLLALPEHLQRVDNTHLVDLVRDERLRRDEIGQESQKNLRHIKYQAIARCLQLQETQEVQPARAPVSEHPPMSAMARAYERLKASLQQWHKVSSWGDDAKCMEQKYGKIHHEISQLVGRRVPVLDIKNAQGKNMREAFITHCLDEKTLKGKSEQWITCYSQAHARLCTLLAQLNFEPLPSQSSLSYRHVSPSRNADTSSSDGSCSTQKAAVEFSE
jgi:hypothetical protein